MTIKIIESDRVETIKRIITNLKKGFLLGGCAFLSMETIPGCLPIDSAGKYGPVDLKNLYGGPWQDKYNRDVSSLDYFVKNESDSTTILQGAYLCNGDTCRQLNSFSPLRFYDNHIIYPSEGAESDQPRPDTTAITTLTSNSFIMKDRYYGGGFRILIKTKKVLLDSTGKLRAPNP